jgi:phosphodiesterase/alkaline phosphatase D-like protein
VSVTLLLSTTEADAATVVARTTPGAAVRLARSASPSLAAPTWVGPVTADGDGYARFTLTGLAADTTYHLGVEVAGTLDPFRGRTRSLPAAGVASFEIAHATCTSYYTDNPSNHRVYDSIRNRSPLFLWMGGDEGYPDIATADSAAMRASLALSLSAPRAAAMHAVVPHVYCWDDHDFGADNSDGTFVGKTQRAAVYRQIFPAHTLPDAGAVYQAWTVGRVRFVQTDNRFYRTPGTAPDTAAKTMLGAAQKAWLKSELLAAKDRPLTVWLNSQVWGVPASGWTGIDTDADHWGAYAVERAEISDYLAANAITNVVQLTGDQHALAIRRAVDYSTAKTAPMRVYSAAALDALPITRNGGWDQVQAGKGQYGTLKFTDYGTWAAVLWRGWQTDPATGADNLVMSDGFTIGTPPAVRAVNVAGVPHGVDVAGNLYVVAAP